MKPNAKLAFTIEEVCEMVSLSRSQIYRLIDQGEIETISIGRARRITLRQVEAFLRGLESKSKRI